MHRVVRRYTLTFCVITPCQIHTTRNNFTLFHRHNLTYRRELCSSCNRALGSSGSTLYDPFKTFFVKVSSDVALSSTSNEHLRQTRSELIKDITFLSDGRYIDLSVNGSFADDRSSRAANWGDGCCNCSDMINGHYAHAQDISGGFSFLLNYVDKHNVNVSSWIIRVGRPRVGIDVVYSPCFFVECPLIRSGITYQVCSSMNHLASTFFFQSHGHIVTCITRLGSMSNDRYTDRSCVWSFVDDMYGHHDADAQDTNTSNWSFAHSATKLSTNVQPSSLIQVNLSTSCDDIDEYPLCFYTENHLVRSQIHMSTIHACIYKDVNVSDFSDFCIIRRILLKELFYDEVHNAELRASLSMTVGVIDSATDTYSCGEPKYPGSDMGSSNVSGSDDMLISRRFARRRDSGHAIFFGLDRLCIQLGADLGKSSDGIVDNVNSTSLKATQYASAVASGGEMRNVRTTSCWIIAQRHVCTDDRSSRQHGCSRLNTAPEVVLPMSPMLPRHFAWLLHIALNVGIVLLDYGEKVFAGICWMQYALVLVVTRMLSYWRAYLTMVSLVTTVGESTFCKFILETCLLR